MIQKQPLGWEWALKTDKVVIMLKHPRFWQVRLVQHSPVVADSDAKRDMKKSAVRGYASEILLLVVRSSGDVTYLKKFSQILLNIGSQDEASRFVPPKS